MKYISTRGEAKAASFVEALLAGLAPDGGLYMPQTYPRFEPATIANFAGAPYKDVAAAVSAPFIGDEIELPALEEMIAAAYRSFRHPAIAPLAQLDTNLFVLELFHGPTFAFKDLAMQLLARLIDKVLAARGERATIIGATSGDTGAAAVKAFAGLGHAHVFILYPHGRISEIQRRQMTTVRADNVYAIAIEGTFDDAQARVKAMFNNPALRERLNLCGINSINFARILFQAVYYFTSAAVLGAPARSISFVVPTGNFGDIFAGWIAKRLGLPIDRLVIATNSNDILKRALESGRYSLKNVQPTQSPSMDIQVSSNFERLLFEASGRNGEAIDHLMMQLRQSGEFSIETAPLEKIRAEFDAFSATELETTHEIKRTWQEAGYLLDPHTAVGVSAARKLPSSKSPVVVLGTAHPGKFPGAIAQALGAPEPPPEALARLLKREEKFWLLPNDQAAIEHFIRAGGAQPMQTAHER